MDKKTIVHVVAEAVILGGVTVYMVNRMSAMEHELKELRVDLQVVAKRQLKIEQNHSHAIRQIGQASQAQPARSMVHHAPPPVAQPVHRPMPAAQRPPMRQAPPVQRVQPPPPVAAPKRVQFTDDEDEPQDPDEELMAREFGEEPEPEEEQDEESEEAPPVVATRARGRKPVRAGVKIPTGPGKKPGARDMDDVKNRAAEMARRAGAE